MRVAHFLSGFESIGETYIYNFVNHHRRSRPFVIIPPTGHREDVKLPGQRVTTCRSWTDVETVLSRERIQIVHAHTGSAGANAILALKRLQLPLIVSFYGNEAAVDTKEPFKQKNHEIIYRVANKLVVPTDYHRRQVTEAGCDPEKIQVVQLGVNVEKFKRIDSSVRPKRLRVLLVGRLIERKGLFDAIEAFHVARVDCPDIELFIAGDGPLRESVERYIARLNLRDSVFMLGALPNNMIAELMQRTDVFMLPCIHTSDGDEDGAPITLLEAQASAIPVISTRHGGIPEMVQHGSSGFLVDERDIHGLSGSLVRLALDPDLRERMGESGRQLVEKNYNIEHQIEQLENLYEDVCGQNVVYRPTDFYRAEVHPSPGLNSLLVLHEGPLLTLYSRLFYLRDRYPQTDISVVMTALHAHLFEDLPFIDQIYPVPGDLVGFLSVSRRFIWKLRRRQFGRVVISSATATRDELLNLELLAMACGGRQTVHLELDFDERPVTFKQTLKTYIDRHGMLARLPTALQHYFRR